jgi:phosphoribosylformylglycinamidine cyclo-ligase
MNVNDLICVGAEPLSMVDYIAMERAVPAVLEEIGKGLHEGARQAGINIVGGETAQIAEMIRGSAPEKGLDLAGTCVGLVPADRILLGQDVVPGDAILGLASSGIHSNGLTLARRALLGDAKLSLTSRDSCLGRTLGEELLEPTRIYAPQVRALLERDLPIKGMVHVTSDGLLNLARLHPRNRAVGYRLDDLPAPHPVFRLIQEAGDVTDAEMYRVFNMGIGFCLVVPADRGIVREVSTIVRESGVEIHEIGRVVEDERQRVFLPGKNLVGEGDAFTPYRAAPQE